MITLIKQAQVFAPNDLGRCDILVCADKIAKVAPEIELSGQDVTVLNADNMIVMPGLVDSLVHFSGGGGEGGFHTRTPEMQFTQASLAGVTTLIGALGTDATSRTHTDLLAKAHALQNEGLSTYCYTGSYSLPARTITGNVTDDIMLIEKMIGVGEVAIADHRGSQISSAELARLAAEARVGGLLSAKAGVVSIHVGDGAQKLALLHQAIEQSDIPASQFYPTHINRNQALLDAGIDWCRCGGFIDMTTSTNEQFIEEGEIPAAKAVAYALSQGVSANQISMSSDGNASLPVFDSSGSLIGLEVGEVASLYQSLQSLVLEQKVNLPDAVRCVTQTPADILKLPHKGRISAGADADLVIASRNSLNIHSVFSRGKKLVEKGKALVTGTFV